MLYDEFLVGTGCKDRACNYKVYRDLEILYVNSDLTKEEIFEYGKKLVNNDLTDAQVEWNRQVDEEIAEYKEKIETLKVELKNCEDGKKAWAENYWDTEWWDREIKYTKRELKRIRALIRGLKETKYV